MRLERFGLILGATVAVATAVAAQAPLYPNSVASNDLDFIRPGDADTYLCLRYEGRDRVEMPDKRGGDLFAEDTYIFRTGFRDGAVIPVWVHRDVGSRANAEGYVAKVGAALGQLPSYMRTRLTRVVIHAGDETAFAEDRGGQVMCDGILRSFAPGERLQLAPGESVTLRPGDWHAFWGEGGDVLIGEVSTVNDDETDNIFREAIGRFADIEEDVDPLHLLVSDYAKSLG